MQMGPPQVTTIPYNSFLGSWNCMKIWFAWGEMWALLLVSGEIQARGG